MPQRKSKCCEKKSLLSAKKRERQPLGLAAQGVISATGTKESNLRAKFALGYQLTHKRIKIREG
jgi:hypothetical protein